MTEPAPVRRSFRLVVRGRVQGVGYRDWMVETAQRIGIDGWVRNCADGSVEVAAAGSETQIAALHDAARRGPRLAQVQSVTCEPLEQPLEARGFTRRPTL